MRPAGWTAGLLGAIVLYVLLPPIAMRPTGSTVTAGLLLTLLSVTLAPAQVITGAVLDDATEQPLDGAGVVLLDSANTVHASTTTGANGAFTLPVPTAGEWLLTAERIGYRPMHAQPVEVSPGERVVVELRMSVEAVALDPLVVTSRTPDRSPVLQAFYDRMAGGAAGSMGSFISREEIERQRAGSPTALFRGEASVRAVRGAAGHGNALRMSAGCVPAIFIDGTQINRIDPSHSLDDYVATQAIEGVEIYRGAAQVAQFRDPRGCGLILVWTRRGVPEDEEVAFSWKRIVGVTVILAGLLLLR